jgi:hypothetical protein
MTIDPRDWKAERNKTLNLFSVEGSIPHAAHQLPDGGYMVTAIVRLLKLDHQPLLPDILRLRLYIEQERRHPYNPPAQPLSHLVSYHPLTREAEEDTCTKVRIVHNGDTVIELEVKDA